MQGSEHVTPVDRTDVLIVGAGPTGLLLAVELVRRGVGCLLIDAHDAPLDWDRATVMHARSIEVFEALGLSDQLLDNAVKVRGALLHSDGRMLGKLDLGLTQSRYGFDVGVSEEVTESILTGLLTRCGGQVTRSARLLGIERVSDHVVATVERNGERVRVVASWIVGCDGVHSVTRGLAGIAFEGTDLQVPWAVFDASLDGWDQDFDMNFAFFDVPPVILCPLPERRWRVYVRPMSDTTDIVSDATRTIHRYAPLVEFAAVENPNRFRCHSRVAERFMVDRVLLAGDAAHACSPSEGHGMNTGMQDAFNLGWKLALACQGLDGPDLLASYEIERRPVALQVVASGDGFESNQALTAQTERAERDIAMRRTFADSGSAAHEAVAAAELGRSYADSALVRGDANSLLAPGDLLPNAVPVVAPSGEACALHELTHRPGHTIPIVGGRAATAEQVAETAARVEAAAGTSVLIDATIALCVEQAEEGIGRISASETVQLGIDGVTILAVRPDRFVGFRHDGTGVRPLIGYLDAFTN
jgi:2-polyprenyl-6-methoxyphenol hydroxylase-like FAD-dependent oxidoreductase